MSENRFRLYRLGEAITAFFADIGLTERDLKREAQAGRLVLTRINKRDFVTEDALREMVAVCQERKAAPDFGSDAKDQPQLGSSSMEESRSALDALNMQIKKLKSGSPNTSRRSMKPPENVVHLKR